MMSQNIIPEQSSPTRSLSSGQMDERFNDNKLPYGWFAEGWKVDSTGVAKKGGFSFDISELLGGLGNQTNGNEPDDNNPDDNPDNQNQTPSFDITKLLGGGSSYNYLMTPPLNVQSGEVLTFSAKKGGASALSSFMSSDSGDEDSTFVVERAVYGEHRWMKVGDFTTELDSVFKTFTISNTDAGEYRFRFRAGGNVEIDSVAGFHIDMDAPDIYPLYQGKNIQPIDLGVCTEDTTLVFSIINTATGTLTVDLSTGKEKAFSLDTKQASIAAADTVKVNLTFTCSQAHEGLNATMLTFKTTDKRVEEIPLPIDAIISQKDKMYMIEPALKDLKTDDFIPISQIVDVQTMENFDKSFNLSFTPGANATGSALEFYSVFMQMMPIVSVSGTSD